MPNNVVDNSLLISGASPPAICNSCKSTTFNELKNGWKCEACGAIQGKAALKFRAEREINGKFYCTSKGSIRPDLKIRKEILTDWNEAGEKTNMTSQTRVHENGNVKIIQRRNIPIRKKA